MAHFARIDKNNIVRRIEYVEDEHLLNEDGEEEEVFGIAYLSKLYGAGFTWVQTSWNTHHGVHMGPSGQPDGGTPLRKNPAAPGMTYDKTRDAFILEKSAGGFNDSWILDEASCMYRPPVAYPGGESKRYDDTDDHVWDEDSGSWIDGPTYRD